VTDGPDWVEVHGTGRIPPFDEDLSDAPDLAPTMAVLALFADGPCRLRRLATVRRKESDRLRALQQALTGLGREVAVDREELVVGPPSGELRGAVIDPLSDHRLAMAFAVAGLRVPAIEIGQPACVAKSNPGFWDQFARLEA
jgi:3-phosphoshikimate 1-carboxyvinyltransferase